MVYYLTAILLVVIDQLVKLWVRGSIPLGQSIPFIPGLMELTYTQNTGAAFSSFSGLTGVLTVISLAASVVIAWMIHKRVFPGALGQLSLTLVLAGAVGNLIDRACLGFVTDMFATTFINFAVFNVADICVTVGGALVICYALFFWNREGKDTP